MAGRYRLCPYTRAPSPQGVGSQKIRKRYPRAFIGWDPRLLRSPHPMKALGLICRLADVNPLQPRNSGLQLLNLRPCLNHLLALGAVSIFQAATLKGWRSWKMKTTPRLTERAVSESLHRVGPTAATQPPPYEGTRAYLSPSGH